MNPLAECRKDLFLDGIDVGSDVQQLEAGWYYCSNTQVFGMVVEIIDVAP